MDPQIFWNLNFFRLNNILEPNFFLNQNFFRPKIFFDSNFCSNFIGTQKFVDPNSININFSRPKIVSKPKNFLGLKFFRTQKLSFYPKFSFGQTFFQNEIFFDSKKCSAQIFFDPKRSSLVLCYKPTKPKSFEPKTFQAEHYRPKSC